MEWRKRLKIAAVDDWSNSLGSLLCFATLDSLDVTIFSDYIESIEERIKQLSQFDAVILIRERTPITRALLQGLPNLKFISLFGGCPNVDIAACSDHGVLVSAGRRSHAPSYAAAEHTWALIMAASKDIPRQMQNLQNGKWQQGLARGLCGRRLGLYGYGRIAKQVADYALAFNMKVEWWGSEQGRARAQSDGRAIAKSRTNFFADNDIISMHVRLTPQTRGLITADDLGKMKPDSLFVNTSRSGLLRSGVLLNALNSGRPGKASIDVFDNEPITWRNDELACHPCVVATPHIGFVTDDEFEMQFSEVFEQVRSWTSGNPINMVNPDIWQFAQHV